MTDAVVERADLSVLDGIKRNVQAELDTAFRKGYKEGKEGTDPFKSMEACIERLQASGWMENHDKLIYENGLNDGWEVARKIYMDSGDGGLNHDTLYEIFDNNSPYIIIKNFSASEAVKRIKEWEDKVKIGDVLRSKFDDCDGIVVNVEDDRYDLVQTNKHTCILSESDLKNYWEKTGKHFDQIGEVLRKMQEDV